MIWLLFWNVSKHTRLHGITCQKSAFFVISGQSSQEYQHSCTAPRRSVETAVYRYSNKAVLFAVWLWSSYLKRVTVRHNVQVTYTAESKDTWRRNINVFILMMWCSPCFWFCPRSNKPGKECCSSCCNQKSRSVLWRSFLVASPFLLFRIPRHALVMFPKPLVLWCVVTLYNACVRFKA